MRKSECYGVNVPELGDRADITVVSQAIIDSENNQSGKVENMKATVSGTIISLTSETRQDALLKYYNGLAIQFISPVDASAGSSYKIKIGSLTEQPYNNKVDIKVGDIVQAIYGSTGFVSANTPIPRSSSVSSNSETTVATSKAVKQAYDKGKEGLDKANTKLNAGAVSVDYNTGKKIEDKIKEKLDKTAVINDLTTGGATNALSAEMGKKIKQNTDDKVDKANIVDNLTTADKSKVLSANMGVKLNINKSDRCNRISDDASDKSKYVKLGTIGINIGNGRNLFSCIMIGGDNFGERNSYKISLQVSGSGSTQNNVYIDAIDAINLSGISRSINGYFIAKPISSNKMEIWYRGEAYSRGFSLEAIYNNGFTINNQMSWIDDDKGTIVETGVYKIFKIKQVMHENNKLFLGNSGISSVIYIQDAGKKTAGNGYVDKTTGQLYLCKITNSDTSVTSNFVLATNIEIAKRQHFTETILFDKPAGHGSGAITLSDNWENYDEFIVYASGDAVDYVGSHRFKKEDIEYSISKDQRFMLYGGADSYWLTKITTGSKTWASGDSWENCAIFRIIGIKYGG